MGGIAAPIYDHDGKVIAAVGIRFIYASVNSQKAETLIKQVCGTAKHVSTDLGYRDADKRHPPSDGIAT